MANDDRLLDTDLIEQFTQDRRLILRRTAVPASALAPSKARPVEQDDAVTVGQTLGERQSHVFEITTGAVDDDDRRHSGGGGSELDHVLTQTPHFNETSARRMRASDQPRTDRGNECAKREHDGDDNKRFHRSMSLRARAWRRVGWVSAKGV